MKRGLVVLLLLCSCSEEPPPEPEKKPAKPKPVEVKPAKPAETVVVKPVKPPAPPPPTLDDRIAALRELGKKSPASYRQLQEGWAALLPEARSAAEKAKFKDELDLLDSEANKAYRQLSKPVRAAVREALDDNRPDLALQALEEWSIPDEFDFQGRLSLDRKTELALLKDLVDVDSRRRGLLSMYRAGDLTRSDKADLAKYLASPQLRVRVEAEKALRETRRLHALQTGRAKLAGLLAQPDSARRLFGEFRESPGPTERRLVSNRPAEAGALLSFARTRLVDMSKAGTLEEFESGMKEGLALLQQATDKHSFFPIPWYVRAEWKYSLLGDTMGALGDLEMAVSQQRNFVEARMARTILMLEVPLWHDAEKELRALSRALPEPSRKAAVEALAKLKAREFDDAKALMVQAMKSMPDDLAFLEGNYKRPEKPDWKGEVSASSEHYKVRVELLAGESDAAAWKAKAEAWAADLEVAREYMAGLVPAPSKATRPAEVLIFADDEHYHDYADVDPLNALNETAGMFLHDRRQLLVQGKADPAQTREILFHEAFHEYISTVGAEVPTWLNEGMADYVSGVTIEGGKITAKGRVLDWRRDQLQSAFHDGWGGIPFSQLLRSNQQEFYGVLRSLQYAQAWSLVHFFRHAKGGEYLPAFVEYVRAITKGATPSAAGQAALGKLDLEVLQAEWLEYVKTLK